MTASHRALLGKAFRALDPARWALRQADAETATDRAYYAAWSLLDLEGERRAQRRVLARPHSFQIPRLAPACLRGS